MGEVMGEAMSKQFDLLLGRKTYDIFAAYWPHASEEAGAKPLNDATKYVASRSHPTLEWRESVLIDGDAAEGVAELKQAGWPGTAGARQRETDPDAAAPQPGRRVPPVGFPARHRVGQAPVRGRHMPSGLKLLDSTVSTTGVVMATYQPAGEIVTGSFALE